MLFVSTVLFYVLFVCKCVLYYCNRVATELQLNIILNMFFTDNRFMFKWSICYSIYYQWHDQTCNGFIM